MEQKIYKFTKNNYAVFRKMFEEYFVQDLKLEYSNDTYDKICIFIAKQIEKEIVFLDLLTVDGDEKGFILYQKDSSSSDWCQREGWGFIREVYLAKELRKLGLGRKMVEHAERQLSLLNVANFYLTTDTSEDFWS